MSERLFGLETEYALAFLGGDRSVTPYDELASRFMHLAQQSLPHLSGAHSSGMFLENAARFYMDCGMHPEMSSPECADPWTMTRYLLAGDRILARLAADFAEREADVGEAIVFKCNVDYSGGRSTWGCHESYLHRGDLEEMPRQIIPHLVSRVIYTGAGGFNPMSPGLEFTLSPRSFHLVRDVSSESTRDRGIFHTKDEPLCRHGYHRLHVLCGESLCSETATWLKVGATALVVAMIEQGLAPGSEVQLKSPVAALRYYAGDPSMTATASGGDGRVMTALEIQRRYLTQAEDCIGEDWMPPWAEDVCREWRRVLDLLAEAPGPVDATLDWAIKQAVCRNYAERHGFKWESLPRWSRVVNNLHRALGRTDYGHETVSVDFILSEKSPVADEVNCLTPYLERHGLRWEGLRPFLDLRRRLFELDMRFGQLGEGGVFAAMDRSGVLSHHVRGVDGIEYATSNPPTVGRARLRGECVKRFSGNGRTHVCEWHAVWDRGAGTMLDLSDPFAAEERWQPLDDGSGRSSDGEPQAGHPDRLQEIVRQMRERREARARA